MTYDITKINGEHWINAETETGLKICWQVTADGCLQLHSRYILPEDYDIAVSVKEEILVKEGLDLFTEEASTCVTKP